MGLVVSAPSSLPPTWERAINLAPFCMKMDKKLSSWGLCPWAPLGAPHQIRARHNPPPIWQILDPPLFPEHFRAQIKYTAAAGGVCLWLEEAR